MLSTPSLALRRLAGAILLLALATAGAPAEPARDADHNWFDAPSISIMTGFVYPPLSDFSQQEWLEGLGSEFDADRWAADFKAAGADYVIFYTKWIDGLTVFDSATVEHYKTERDFVAEMAEACRRHDLKLVVYWNAVSDGNPEYEEWALRDRDGELMIYAPAWPTLYQTLHSPFRQKSVTQLRELVSNYGPIGGLWLDIFREHPMIQDTSSKWVIEAYEAMMGEPWSEATPASLSVFKRRTMEDYLEEIQPIIEAHQDDFALTSNGSAGLKSRAWREGFERFHTYGSTESHEFKLIDKAARQARLTPIPMEIGYLINSTWFTPLADEPPRAAYNADQVLAGVAVSLTQGASVYFAITPGHSGRFGEDLDYATRAGRWFERLEPQLKQARPGGAFPVIVGMAGPDSPPLNQANNLWPYNPASNMGMLEEAVVHEDALARAGCFGTLLAFGHASRVDGRGRVLDGFALADLFGAEYAQTLPPPPGKGGIELQADSIYSLGQFGTENLTDGDPATFMGTGEGMPHWVDVRLPEEELISAIEILNRQGPYQIHDLDIEWVHDGERRVVAQVRHASQETISIAFDPPRPMREIRIKALRETYADVPRDYLDIAELRVISADGRDLAQQTQADLALKPADPAWTGAAAGLAPTIPPLRVVTRPTTARVLARFGDAAGTPAVLMNTVGEGRVIYVATNGAALEQHDDLWTALRRLALGEPTALVEGPGARPLRRVFNRVDDGHVFHLIDPKGGEAGHVPGPVTVRLNAARLGAAGVLTRLETGERIELRREGDFVVTTVTPDPVASLHLR